MKLIFLCTLFFLTSLPSLAKGPWVVSQKNKQFSVSYLDIQQGEQVSFPNLDDVYHNVFSLSETKTFDLGTYPKGATKLVTFDQKGKVLVQCAIHPQMRMIIHVH